MNILAVDCCLKLTGVAVMSGEKFSSEQKNSGRRQSLELPLIAEKLLNENNLRWNDIDYAVLTNGPGYFTGIRVGASYVSGIAYACNAKIIPISSLKLLSHSYKTDAEKVLTLIYAGHGFVYGECEKFLEAGEYPHKFIKEWLKNNSDAEIISDDPERTELDIKINEVKPNMFSLCELALKNIDSAKNPMELKISYYRPPQGMY